MNSSDPVILAVETSQRQGSVAIRVRGGDTRSLSFPCGTRHDDHLLPSIETLFDDAGLEPGSLDAVGVSIGPGGFTGLRIGVSTAKGIVEVTHCQLLAVPSACVAAESLRPQLDIGDRVVVASAAKSTTCWVTELVMAADRWTEVGEASIHTIDPPSPAVIALCNDAHVLADEHVPGAFQEAVSPVARRIEAPEVIAESCLCVAMGMLQRGETTDPLLVTPLYPREPEAVTLWRHRRESGVE